MANTDIAITDSLIPFTKGYAVDESLTEFHSGVADELHRVTFLRASNETSNTSITVTVEMWRNGSKLCSLASGVAVENGLNIIASGEVVFLGENDDLRASASANNAISLALSYERYS